MENQKTSPKQFILNYGVILGVVSIIFSVLMYAVQGMNFEPPFWQKALGYIFSIVIIYFGIKKFKESNNGFLKIGQAIKIGVGIALIAAILIVIFTFIFSNFIEPDFQEKLLDFARNKILESNPEATDDELEILAYAFYNKEKELHLLNRSLQERIKEATKELEKEKIRFTLAIEGAQDSLWDWDIEANELFFSERYETMLGYDAGEIPQVIDSWFALLHPDDKEKASIIVQEYLDLNGKSSYENTFRLQCKDGSSKWILARGKAQFDKDGKPLRFVGFNTDITERKEREKELILTKEKAIKASKSKSEFVANMSHEIRTPLNGVIGLTNLVLETKLDDTQKEYLNRSISSANALLHIINDILDYSKIEAKKIELEHIPFKLNESLDQLNSLFSYQIIEKEIDFKSIIDSNVPNNLIGDPFRIIQILTNLMGNAIKFTNQGFIKILVSSQNIDDKNLNLKIAIKDSGIGISDEKKNRLFKEFSQVDTSNTREYGGTGLGLTISKKLAKLMNGEISVESKEGEGSTFSLEVTVAYDKNRKSDIDNAKVDNNKEKTMLNARILLVEDNYTNQLVASINLKKLGLEVEIADNGAIAVEKVKESKFDLILMDLQMPVMDGFEATRRIREFDKTIPIIALSAAVMQEDIKLTKDVGMDAHLAKPIDIKMLQDTLIKYLNIKFDNDIQDEVLDEMNLHGIDTKELYARFNNKISIANKLLIDFAKDKKDFMKKLELLDPNSEEFDKELHNLKGLSGNLSLTDVFQYSASIYQNKDIKEKTKLLEKLKKSFTIAIDSINRFIVPKLQNDEDNTIKFSEDELLEMLENINSDVKTGSFITQERISKLLSAMKDIVNEESINELENYFSSFDYDGLHLSLLRIIEKLAEPLATIE